MIELVFALSMFYSEAIIDLEPLEMREAFDTWLSGRYPDYQNPLTRALEASDTGVCERLCISGVRFPEYN